MEYYLEHSAKGTHWSKKNHKYIAIKNGVYIYPKSRYEKDNAELRGLMSRNRRRYKQDKDARDNQYMRIELNKHAGRYKYDQYQAARMAVRDKWLKTDSQFKNVQRANQSKQLRNTYRYQHSLNYKIGQAMKKGAAFIKRLFGKNR